MWDLVPQQEFSVYFPLLLQKVWPLFLAALTAGFVDSIGGGGGLITVPTLLTIGVPAPLILGTNKCMSTIGSLPAVIRYARAGLLPPLRKAHLVRIFFLAAALSALGAYCSEQKMIIENFPVIIPGLLIVVMLFMLKRWFIDEAKARRVSSLDLNETETIPSLSKKMQHPLGMISLLAVAFYDGLFGPGTGTFFLTIFEGMGLKTITANAITKIFNLASNLGALLWFISRGKSLILLGLSAASCYLIGNYLGAGFVLRRGQSVVRVFVLLATTALLIKHLSRYL